MSAVPCSHCSVPLPVAGYNSGRWFPCTACGRQTRVTVFPAILRSLGPGRSGERILTDGQAGCFYHADRKAVVPCDCCGRFLCELCDMEVGSKHYCTHCLEQAHEQNGAASLENRRILYGKIALALAVVPLLVWPFTAVSAPAAIILAVWSWRRPQSILGRSQLRKVLAIVAGAIILFGWVFFFYSAFTGGLD